MHRQLPAHQRYPLPPRRITMTRGGESRREEAPRRDAAHRPDAPRPLRLRRVRRRAVRPASRRATVSRSIPAGIGYGLLVWAGSYLGLLPALGFTARRRASPSERNALMIAAHVVWGALRALAPCFADQCRMKRHAKREDARLARRACTRSPRPVLLVVVDQPVRRRVVARHLARRLPAPAGSPWPAACPARRPTGRSC